MNEKVKKVLRMIKTVIVTCIVVLAVAMMLFTIISVTTFNRNDRTLCGYKAYIVNSDSMAKTDFKAGDLIFVKEVSMSELKEGDIISFISRSTESFGETITHKIDRKTVDENGHPGFITYGTTTNTDDEAVIRADFERLITYRNELAPHFGEAFDIISMGMSDDYPLAIECGSTMIRVGSKIFGYRNYL